MKKQIIVEIEVRVDINGNNYLYIDPNKLEVDLSSNRHDSGEIKSVESFTVLIDTKD